MFQKPYESTCQEMIEKLLNEANEEATHKAFCDEELSKSRASQEEKTMKLDKYSARIDSATTTMAELEEAIKGLEGEIAEMDAAMAEASKIRNEEHEDYVKASSDFKASAEAVAAAIQVLKSYYEGSFIQLSAKGRAGREEALSECLPAEPRERRPVSARAAGQRGGLQWPLRRHC